MSLAEKSLMERRSVLKGLAAAAALSAIRPALAQPFRRVRPGDPGWPTPQEWEALKTRVGGTLMPVEPLFGVCRGDQGAAPCHGIEKDIENPFFIGDQAAGTQTSGWLRAWTSAPSVYAVKARHAADVAAALNFARAHNLRVAVKGGGHSYQGTSNAADSLLIWTRAMNDVTLHENFVGTGCEGVVPP